MIPILHFPGEMMPGQFGPIRRVCLALQKFPRACTMSAVGMPSVMHTTSGTPASAASMIASAANGGGTKITEALAPVCLHGVRNGVEHRQVQMRLTALARRHAAHHLGAVSDGLLGVETCLRAGEALKQDSSVLIYQYAHALTSLAASTTFSAASRIPSATVKLNPEFFKISCPILDVGAFHANHDGHLDVQLARRVHHAGGQRVAAQNAAENIDQHRLHARIR